MICTVIYQSKYALHAHVHIVENLISTTVANWGNDSLKHLGKSMGDPPPPPPPPHTHTCRFPAGLATPEAHQIGHVAYSSVCIFSILYTGVLVYGDIASQVYIDREGVTEGQANSTLLQG